MTLCRFDDKPGPVAKIGPFIPCERRLAISNILEIQGRDFRAGFLKQGLCQASSRFLVDTPGLLLTLGYITLNLALIGLQEGYLRVREPWCAEGPGGPGVPWGHGRALAMYWLGPGNTNQPAGWVLPLPRVLPSHPPRVLPVPHCRTRCP